MSYVHAGIGMGVRFLNLEDSDRDRIAAYVDRTMKRPVMQGEFHLRKSSRVAINVPVRVRTSLADGGDVDERTQIITLSKHGACLLLSGREFKSSVVWVGDGPSRKRRPDRHSILAMAGALASGHACASYRRLEVAR